MKKNIKTTKKDKINPKEIFLQGVNVGGLYERIESSIKDIIRYSKNVGRYKPENIEAQIIISKVLTEVIFSQIYQTEEKYSAGHSKSCDVIGRYHNAHKELCYEYASKCRPWGVE